MSSEPSTEPQPAVIPLPRGRHKLPRQHVRDSQRERLVRAMLECAFEHGYAATTIAHVVAKARVSRTAFYDLFEDKEACFLEACDEITAQFLDELFALAGEASWIGAVRKGVRHYLHWWQRHPQFAGAYLVELPTAGRRALEQRDRSHARFVAMFEQLAAWARTEQPELPPLSPLALRLLVPSITELVAEEIRAGRLDELDRLEEELAFHIVRTLADDATARRLSSSSSDGAERD